MNPADTSPSLNGEHQVPEKKPRKPRKPKPLPEGIRIVGVPQECGVKLTYDDIENLEWFLDGWIPRGMLTLVSGMNNIGKSSFVAWLIRKAKRAMIMPGFEESVKVLTLRRFQAAGVNPEKVRWLINRPGQPKYALPRDYALILRAMLDFGADLLVSDPIDSYMDPKESEDKAVYVRPYLESYEALGQATKAAVVGIRHPGKDEKNTMPGSRAWRDVPRSRILLVHDASQPGGKLMKHDKSPTVKSKPRRFSLVGEENGLARFVLEGETEDGMPAMEIQEAGPVGRRKVMRACLIIRDMFSAPGVEPTVGDLVKRCKEDGVGDASREDAMLLLGIETRIKVFGGKHVMERPQKDWPSWLQDGTPKQ